MRCRLEHRAVFIYKLLNNDFCHAVLISLNGYDLMIFIVIIPGLEIASANTLPIEPGVTGLQSTSVQKYGID